MPKKGYKQTKEHKRKISIKMKGKRNSLGYKQTDSAKRKISIKMLGNKHTLGCKWTEKTKKKMSKSHKIFYLDPKEREKQVKTLKEFYSSFEGKECRKDISKKVRRYHKEHPEIMEILIKNGFGKKCKYKGEFFPSLQERDCYIELKKLGFKVVHNFENRFDFLINDRIVLEYHPCGWFLEKRSKKEYYKDRRKLLNILGYKYFKLFVIENLKELENLRK